MYVGVDYMVCIVWEGVFFITDVHFVAVHVFVHYCIFSWCACFSTLMCVLWVCVFFNMDVYFIGVRVLQI